MARQQLVVKNASELVHRSACGDLTTFEYNAIPCWCDEVARLHKDPSDIEPLEIWKQYREIWSSLTYFASFQRARCTASQRLALARVYAEKASSIATLFALEDCPPLTAAYFRLLHHYFHVDADIAELM